MIAPEPQRRPRARVMTPGAGLYSARVAWRHSLRFRLALVYTLAGLAIIAVIGMGMVLYLLGQMDRQFQQRLNERAEVVAEGFTNPQDTLGRAPPPTSGYTAVLDNDGNIQAVSPALQASAGRTARLVGMSSCRSVMMRRLSDLLMA